MSFLRDLLVSIFGSVLTIAIIKLLTLEPRVAALHPSRCPYCGGVAVERAGSMV